MNLGWISRKSARMRACSAFTAEGDRDTYVDSEWGSDCDAGAGLAASPLLGSCVTTAISLVCSSLTCSVMSVSPPVCSGLGVCMGSPVVDGSVDSSKPVSCKESSPTTELSVCSTLASCIASSANGPLECSVLFPRISLDPAKGLLECRALVFSTVSAPITPSPFDGLS